MHNRTRTPTHNHTRRHSRAHAHTNTRTRTHAHTHARACSQLCTVHMHSAPADAASSACRHGKLSSMGYRHRRALLLRRAVQPHWREARRPNRCAALISEIVLRTGTPVVAIDYRRSPVLTGYSVLTAYSQGTRCLRVYWYVLAVIRDRTARADRCRSIHSRRRRQTASSRINRAQRRCGIAAACPLP